MSSTRQKGLLNFNFLAEIKGKRNQSKLCSDRKWNTLAIMRYEKVIWNENQMKKNTQNREKKPGKTYFLELAKINFAAK